MKKSLKIPLLIISLAGLLLLSGCMEYEESLVIYPDGSGTIQMKYAIDKTYFDQMREMYKTMAETMPGSDIPSDPTEMMFNKDKIDSSLIQQDRGVALIDYKKYRDEQSDIWEMGFSFDDVNKLYIIGSVITPEDQSDMEPEATTDDIIKIYTKQPDGTFKYYRPLDDYDTGEGTVDDAYNDYESDSPEYGNEDEDNASGATDEAQQVDEEIQDLFTNLADSAQDLGDKMIIFHVTFPGKIIESNATTIEGNTATWQYKLSEINGDIPVQEATIQPDTE